MLSPGLKDCPDIPSLTLLIICHVSLHGLAAFLQVA